MTNEPRMSIPLMRGFCVVALCAACNGTTTAPVTTIDDTSPDSSLSGLFSVSCDEDSLDISIYRSRDRSWWMGVAVTDPREDDPWTGEDCHRGDTLDGESYLYCHPLDENITRLTFGADPLTLQPGEQTALHGPDICDSLTFYFFETTTTGCWVAGHTADYYEGLCDNQVTLQ